MNKRKVEIIVKDKQEEREGDQHLLIRMSKGKRKVTTTPLENE